MYDMPTIKQCIEHYGEDKFYVQSGFDRFKSDSWVNGMPSSDFELYFESVLDDYRITPIISDPTNVDSDGDYYSDGSFDYYNNNRIEDPTPMSMINAVEAVPYYVHYAIKFSGMLEENPQLCYDKLLYVGQEKLFGTICEVYTSELRKKPVYSGNKFIVVIFILGIMKNQRLAI